MGFRISVDGDRLLVWADGAWSDESDQALVSAYELEPIEPVKVREPDPWVEPSEGEVWRWHHVLEWLTRTGYRHRVIEPGPTIEIADLPPGAIP